jgi:hypothetical protein
MNLRALVDVELLLSAIANKKFNYQILIRVLRWVVPIFFFLNLPMGRHFFTSTVPSGDMMDFQHTPIYRYGWQARIMFAKWFVAVGG